MNTPPTTTILESTGGKLMKALRLRCFKDQQIEAAMAYGDFAIARLVEALLMRASNTDDHTVLIEARGAFGTAMRLVNKQLAPKTKPRTRKRKKARKQQ